MAEIPVFNFATFGKLQKKFKSPSTQKNEVLERLQINFEKTMFFRSCAFIFNLFSFIKYFVARIVLVELHQDDVLAVRLVVGLKFVNLQKLVDKYHRKIHWKN